MIIVLLPGMDGTGLLFKPLLKYLPKSIKTLVISYPDTQCLSYDELTQYVANVLPKEDYILLAESFSGYIAYQIAKQKPKYLKSIIFVASFLKPPRPYLLWFLKLIPVSLLLSGHIPTLLIRKFLLGNNASDELINLFRMVMVKVPNKVLAYRLREINNMLPVAGNINCRAVYVQANNDYLVQKNSFSHFRYLFPCIKLIKNNGAHFIVQSHPKVIANIIQNEMNSIF